MTSDPTTLQIRQAVAMHMANSVNSVQASETDRREISSVNLYRHAFMG